MIRVILENILLFFVPTIVYLVYVLVNRSMKHPGAAGGDATATATAGVLDDAPLLWLFGAGALLVVVMLAAFGSTSGGKPGQHYEPSVYKDGRIEPGEIK